MREQVERVAALANLELDEADLDLFARQLGEILAYASEVQQVDTRGVPPTSHVVTRHTAEGLDEGDLALFARHPGEILAYASEGQQVDPRGVPPTSHVVTRHTAERPDEL